MSKSQIQDFFKDQTVFITGGTGFFGKILVEKLLYSCQVRKIYILTREKKGKTTQERRQDYFNFACFNRIKEKSLDLEDKVSFIKGDLNEITLGLDEEAKRSLINETSVIFHAGANVKFDQSLQEAYNINVRGTSEVLDLAKKMDRLRAFVYVSTAYSHCPRSRIVEKFYQAPITSSRLAKIIEGLNEELLTEITPKLINPWPNSYAFTRAIAEDLLQKEWNELPLAIIRPAIVTSTVAKPFPGWVDNLYGPMGIVIGEMLGVVRSKNIKLSTSAYLIPVDYAVNASLAIASKLEEEKNCSRIYNHVRRNNTPKWGFLLGVFKETVLNYPTQKMLWQPLFNVKESRLWHKICVFLYHNIPAYTIDIILKLIGRKPLAVEKYKKINKSIDLLSYFTTREWWFDVCNIERLWDNLGDFDKSLFDFDLDKIDWLSYIEDGVRGAREHILKDPLDTLPKAREKLILLRVAHYSFLSLIYILILMFVRMVMNWFYVML